MTREERVQTWTTRILRDNALADEEGAKQVATILVFLEDHPEREEEVLRHFGIDPAEVRL